MDKDELVAKTHLPELDGRRWDLIKEALITPNLTTDLSRLAAISCIVNSRIPLTEAEILALFKYAGPLLSSPED